MNTLTLRDRWSLYLDLVRWNRPQGWLLLLWPTYVALWLAAGGFPGWHLLLVFTLGTILMRSAGCAVNDVADKDFDLHVQRTAQRPITSGRISVKEALGVGAVLALLAFALVLTTNALTIALSFGALAVTIIYPYTKRFFSMPQAVLGVAFSFGIPMAYAAIQQQVPAVVWWLVVGNLAWVLAYDTEYAMVDRNDDLKIGIRTSAITLGRFDVIGVMGFYALCLACWYHVGQLSGRGVFYELSLAVAAGHALWHGWLIKSRVREDCFKAFRLNHWLGLTVWLGVVADTVWPHPFTAVAL
ncbi:4-hydroxybenzoate octaprenyltransferase [Aquabacterium sp.]|uniref:4-hydroxybenzoate octaprenyltransferase n=1 Tax=Aquabacterium sp. TaxID=1872578 RepID=UPI0040382BB0